MNDMEASQWSRVRNLLEKAKFPTSPPFPNPNLHMGPMIQGKNIALRSTAEEKLTRLEEARQSKMEVAQEEDEAPQARAEDAQGIMLNSGGMG